MAGGTLLNQRTGTTWAVDIADAALVLPALLPSSPVQRGMQATNQRSRLPTEVQVDVMLAAVPADADDPAVVLDELDVAADNADRLLLVVPGLPTVGDLMIGDRVLRPNNRNTSVLVTVSLRQVRIITESVGDASFPEPVVALESGLTSESDGGQQAPEEPERQARASALKILTGGT